MKLKECTLDALVLEIYDPKNRIVYRNEGVAMMEQMDLIDLVQLRDVAREMTKKEGLPAGTSEAL